MCPPFPISVTNWLQERLTAAQIAALSVEAAPNQHIPALLRERLLKTARVHAVAVKRNRIRYLIMAAEMPEDIHDHYDLRDTHWSQLILDALKVFVAPDGRAIRVIGRNSLSGDNFIEIVVDEKTTERGDVPVCPQHRAFIPAHIGDHGGACLFCPESAAGQPMQNLTSNMVDFSRNPEDTRRIIKPSDRLDEIGTAERELADMQKQLSGTLRQKNHLAALGLAVSKINHDLRNIPGQRTAHFRPAWHY